LTDPYEVLIVPKILRDIKILNIFYVVPIYTLEISCSDIKGSPLFVTSYSNNLTFKSCNSVERVLLFIEASNIVKLDLTDFRDIRNFSLSLSSANYLIVKNSLLSDLLRAQISLRLTEINTTSAVVCTRNLFTLELNIVKHTVLDLRGCTGLVELRIYEGMFTADLEIFYSDEVLAGIDKVKIKTWRDIASIKYLNLFQNSQIIEL
jgi:hypothetical protein